MRQQGNRAWHKVRQNETTKQPRRHVFVDTEALTSRVPGGHEQTWRLGCATFVDAPKGRKKSEHSKDYHSPEDLWKDVGAFTSTRGRTVVWAHNIGYDIRVSRALETLVDLGWTMVAHNISARATWLEWRRDGATLLMADSSAVFPTTLAKIGALFGLGKVRMDMDSTDESLWLSRCRRDVEILKTAIMTYLEWLETEDLGNWQITGAGQSWALFRHRFLTHDMVVHSEPDVIAMERRAMWAGRCEAYWKGEIRAQTVHEWDFTQAYARIARDESVPVRLIGPMPRQYDWRASIESKGSALLARVRVSTDVPVLPTERDGRILWPVGEFETTVWDVEIAEALRAGARIEVMQGFLYRKRPALKAWGEWVIGKLDAPESDCPTWQKAILKHHSRALIGRMAMMYNDWQEYGEMPHCEVRRSTLWDEGSDTPTSLMQIGRTVWIDAGRVESSESMPMVTGYIQAIARVRLWQAMSKLPEKVLLYVDTDSLIVSHNYLADVERVAQALSGYGLRLKRSWDGFGIYGPRQIVTGQQVRVSGVPSRARRVEHGRFDGEIFQSLSHALAAGRTGRVVTRDRTWTVDGTDHRREGSAPGWTQPVTLGRDKGGPSEGFT